MGAFLQHRTGLPDSYEAAAATVGGRHGGPWGDSIQ